MSEMLARYVVINDGRYATDWYYTWYADGTVHLLTSTADDDDWNSVRHESNYTYQFDSLTPELQEKLKQAAEKAQTDSV